MALYIVATPIGNLADMTYRAVIVLKEADLICAEDTRTSKKLLDHYGIETPVTAYHDFNKERVTPNLLQSLKDGASLALISDAGTPVLSDPGYVLVRAAIDAGIRVCSVP